MNIDKIDRMLLIAEREKKKKTRIREKAYYEGKIAAYTEIKRIMFRSIHE